MNFHKTSFQGGGYNNNNNSMQQFGGNGGFGNQGFGNKNTSPTLYSSGPKFQNSQPNTSVYNFGKSTLSPLKSSPTGLGGGLVGQSTFNGIMGGFAQGVNNGLGVGPSLSVNTLGVNSGLGINAYNSGQNSFANASYGNSLQSGFNTSQSGTKVVHFQPLTFQENQNSIQIQAISAMKEYQSKSHEELRFEDYKNNYRGGSSSSLSSTAPFGSFSAPAFGTNPSPFGNTAPASFGSAAPAFSSSTPFTSTAQAPSFVIPAATTPATNTALFGAPATTTPSFSSPFAPSSTQVGSTPPNFASFTSGVTNFAANNQPLAGSSFATNNQALTLGANNKASNSFMPSTSTPTGSNLFSSSPAPTNSFTSFAASPNMFAANPIKPSTTSSSFSLTLPTASTATTQNQTLQSVPIQQQPSQLDNLSNKVSQLRGVKDIFKDQSLDNSMSALTSTGTPKIPTYRSAPRSSTKVPLYGTASSIYSSSLTSAEGSSKSKLHTIGSSAARNNSVGSFDSLEAKSSKKLVSLPLPGFENNNDPTAGLSFSTEDESTNQRMQLQTPHKENDRPIGDPTNLTPRHQVTPINVTNLPRPEDSHLLPPQPPKRDIPTLGRKGYRCSPTINKLGTLTDSDLQKVSNFTIAAVDDFDNEIGRIQWIDPVDLRGLNLDDIVNIVPNRVSCYEKDPATTPQVGQGLNKPAVITIFTKKYISKDRLKKLTEDKGNKFIDYNEMTGAWMFQVEHFSGYGLTDDELMDLVTQEDEEPLLNTIAHADIIMEEPIHHVTHEKNISYTPSPAVFSIESTTYKKSPSSRGRPGLSSKLTSSKLPETNRKLYAGGGTGIGIGASIGSSPSGQTTRFDQAKKANSITIEDTRSNYRNYIECPIERSHSMKILRSVQDHYHRKTGQVPEKKEVFSKAIGTGKAVSKSQQKNPADFSLFMGRSFRVGWGPHNEIIYATNCNKGQGHKISVDNNTDKKFAVQVSKLDPLKWMKSKVSMSSTQFHNYIEGPLHALLHQSTLSSSSMFPNLIQPSSISLPLVAPKANMEDTSEYKRFLDLLDNTINSYEYRNLRSNHPDWYALKAVELISATWGQEKGTEAFRGNKEEYIPTKEATDRGQPYWERRREMISKWLEEMCSVDKDEKFNSNNAGTYKRIFHLLSCRKIYDALNLAEDEGLFRLATIISQASENSDVTVLIKQQLDLWSANGVDDTIDDDIIQVYKLLGGDFMYNDDHHPTSCILSEIGWIRAISAFYWYNKSPWRQDCEESPKSYGKLSSAIREYQYYLSQEPLKLVQEPQSYYHDDPDPLAAIVKYNLNNQKHGLHTQHGLYSLLLSLFSDEVDDNDVIACLRSEGFTRDPLDYRTPYVILNLLECIGITNQNKNHTSIVRCHFISQLLSLCDKDTSYPYWKWAVLVALQIKNDIQRDILVKKIIHQYACNWYDKTDSDEYFLVNQLKISKEWIDEALAFKAGYNYDIKSQVKHLYHCIKNEEMGTMLSNVICSTVLPTVIFVSDEMEKKLKESLDALEKAYRFKDTRSFNKNRIYLNFFKIKNSIRELKGIIYHNHHYHHYDCYHYYFKDKTSSETSSEMGIQIKLFNDCKNLFDAINNLSNTNNNNDDLSINEYDNNNVILYYMGTELYRNMKHFQKALGLGDGKDLMMMNKVKVDEIIVSNDDSLKLLHKEISLALSNVTSDHYRTQ